MVLGTMAVIVAFKMHFWNVGVAGQLTMGRDICLLLCLPAGKCSPPRGADPADVCGGAVGGAFWGFLPAYAKVRWNTSETLFCPHAQLLATYIVQLLRRGPWEDPMMPSFGQCPMFVDNARLTKILGCSSGWIAALVILILVTVYLQCTRSRI